MRIRVHVKRRSSRSWIIFKAARHILFGLLAMALIVPGAMPSVMDAHADIAMHADRGEMSSHACCPQSRPDGDGHSLGGDTGDSCAEMDCCLATTCPALFAPISSIGIASGSVTHATGPPNAPNDAAAREFFHPPKV